MLSPFEYRPLVETGSLPDVRIHSNTFATSPLPAFVVRQAGATLDEAMDNIAPYLHPSITLQSPIHDLSFSNITHDDAGKPLWNECLGIFKGDYGGLHADAGDPSAATTEISFHFMEESEARGYFFLPSPVLVKRLAEFNRASLPDDTTLLFRQGLVDRNTVEPICYWADLLTGDMVVFSEGLPVVHGFDTLRAPRHSRVRRGILNRPSLLLPHYLRRRNEGGT